MIEKATTKTTRRNVGEIIQRGRIYYIRYYDGRGRRRLETTKSTKREDAEKQLRKRLSAKDAGVLSIVGHKTESIYRRYAIVDEAMQREAAARLDAWMAAPPAAPSTATVTALRRGSRRRGRVTG